MAISPDSGASAPSVASWKSAAESAWASSHTAGGGPPAAVLEVTQVGRALQPDGGVRLFAHTPRSDGGGADPAAELLAALRHAAEDSAGAAPGGVSVAPAGSEAPGVPPTASAGSFVRLGRSGGAPVPAALLAGFDSRFAGATYHTQFDSLPTVDASSIAAAAAVVARAAHALALGALPPGAPPPPPLPVDYPALGRRVQDLMQCLLNSSLGLNCPLARAMLTPVRGGHVARYVGVLRTLTADAQTPDAAVKSDSERFVWNFLAFATAPGVAPGQPLDGASAGDLQRCQPLNATSCPLGHVCAGSRGVPGPSGWGVCLNATARYVPAYSTALACDGCDGERTQWDRRWRVTDAAAAWEQQLSWPPDPLWTESNWPRGVPALALYLREAPGTERALLAAGMAAAAASFGGALALRAAHDRKLKRQ